MRCDNEYFSQHPAPLPASELEVLHPLVEWDEIVLGPSSIRVKGTCVEELVCFKFHRAGNK